MKFLKLYEEFKVEELEDTQIEKDLELSDKTVDDVLHPDFFKKQWETEEEVSKDKRGVYHIKNWKQY